MRKKLDYKWVIAAVLFMVYFLAMGLGNATSSLYIVPVTEHFGFSRGDFSLVYTLITIGNALLLFGYGWLARRYTVRVIISAGFILVPLGFLVFYFATSLPAFYAGALIFGAGLGLSALTSVSILVNNWFDRGQGTVLGVIAAGSGLGGAVCSPLIAQVITVSGFQSAFLLTAAILAAAFLPVALLIKSQPAVRPARVENHPASSTGPPLPLPEPVMSGRELMRKPAILLGLTAVFLFGFLIHPIWAITPAYMVEKGYSQVTAAAIFSGLMLALAGGKIVLGSIHDRFGIRTALLVGMGSFVIAAVLLVQAESGWMIWLYMIFDGLSLASLSILIPLFARTLLGQENYSAYLGIFVAIMNTGASLGVPMVNYAFDLTGTYAGITTVFAGLGVATLLLVNFLLAKKPAG